MPALAVEALVRFETKPGRQMQADWAMVGRGADKLSLFIATLGRSRSAHVEFCNGSRDQRARLCGWRDPGEAESDLCSG